MPEINECRASADLVQCFIQAMKAGGEDAADEELRLLNLWSDPTDAEMKAAKKSRAQNKDPRIQEGHVYVLKPTAKILRGSSTSQTPVYPQMLSNKKQVTVKDQKLWLDDAESTPRDVVLCFKNSYKSPIFGQVCAHYIESTHY